MEKSFKQWLAIQEIAMGSDGMRDNKATQTNQSAAKVGQQWMANDRNAPAQASMIASVGNKSTLGKSLMNAGADALNTAHNGVASQTTAPMVANFLQTSLGLPKVIQPPKPGQIMMRKK